jgi:hypothetical protein
VWIEFASNPERCHQVAETIRQAIASPQEDETVADVVGNGGEEAEEGRVITAMRWSSWRLFCVLNQASPLRTEPGANPG